MNKATRKTTNNNMRAEYDFSGGVRGKHYQAMQSGYTVRIRQPNGSVVVKQYKPADGTIVLAPDVRRYFPNADVVNNTLRSLITLVPNKRRVAVKKAHSVDTVRRMKARGK